jgi:lysophospholipase L1-like esterase
MKLVNRLLAIAIPILILSAQLSLPSKASAAVAATLNYTAMGDSLAYGILDLERGGYVPRYGSFVQADTGSTVLLKNLGQNGWTSTRLLNALRTDANFRSSVASSQVVTWDIGGNDFLRNMDDYRNGTCGGADNQNCLRDAAAAFKANWNDIITEIISLRSTGNTLIRTMDIYNPFVKAQKASDSWTGDGGLNDFQVIKPYLDDANKHIATTAAANNIPCAKVYQAFNGPNGDEDAGDKGYISVYDPSGVHPNELGHAVIASLFRGLGYVPLVGEPMSVQLSQSAYSVSEGAGSLNITVTRKGDKSAPATVKYSTSDTTDANFQCSQVNTGAASRKCDYHIAVGTLRFAAGEDTKQFTLSIVNDVYVESPETLTITLTNPVGVTLGQNSTVPVTITDDDSGGAVNPIDNTSFFVRQLYVDLLSREPDPAGWNGWTTRIDQCGQPGQAPPPCDRVTVAGDGFLRSGEFFDRQFFVLRLYRTGLGRILRYDEIGDLAYVSGFLTDAQLELNKQDLVNEIVGRAEFAGKYNGLDNTQFVDALLQTADVTVPTDVRLGWIASLNNSSKTRAQVFREISERQEVSAKYAHEAQVVSAYYGFFTRNPDGAYLSYLQRLDSGEITLADLANAFINASEYRQRFGQ